MTRESSYKAQITGVFFLHMRTILLAFLMLGVPVYSYSQACCSGGVPLGGSLGLGTAESKSLQLLLTYDYNVLNDLMDGPELLKDNTRSRTTHSSINEINYGISTRFTFTGVVPFIRQERSIRSYGGAEDFTATQGLGDAVFLIKYRLFDPTKKPDLEWVIGAGPKFPTGKTDYTNNDGLVLVADMQPGSGSVDGIVWSYFQKRKFGSPNLSLMAVSSFRYSGENKTYNKTQVYGFGNEFQFNLGLNYNLFVHWPTDVFSYLRYRRQAEDLIDGSIFPGSGGQWIYLIPGMNINFSPRLSFRMSGDVPLYRKLKGTQLTTSYKLTAAVLYTIPSKNRKVNLN